MRSRWSALPAFLAICAGTFAVGLVATEPGSSERTGYAIVGVALAAVGAWWLFIRRQDV